MPFLRGPLRIINISGEQGDTYTLQDIVNNRQRSYHISKLRPYDHDPNKHDPLEAAIRDDQYHIIDSIKSFKETGDKQRHLKTNFTFKVHWKGYKTSEDSWEPYLNIKNTKVFYDFIKDNKNPRLRKLLPKNLIFTEEVEEIVSEDDNDPFRSQSNIVDLKRYAIFQGGRCDILPAPLVDTELLRDY